jgi:hypothetical protein
MFEPAARGWWRPAAADVRAAEAAAWGAPAAAPAAAAPAAAAPAAARPARRRRTDSAQSAQSAQSAAHPARRRRTDSAQSAQSAQSAESPGGSPSSRGSESSGASAQSGDEQRRRKREQRRVRLTAGHCACKRSRCLKLYCVCFAADQPCAGSCDCNDCGNGGAEREIAVRGVLERNPGAFAPRVAQSGAAAEHLRGCHCRNSACVKLYCECFASGARCGSRCECSGCANGAAPSPARSVV